MMEKMDNKDLKDQMGQQAPMETVLQRYNYIDIQLLIVVYQQNLLAGLQQIQLRLIRGLNTFLVLIQIIHMYIDALSMKKLLILGLLRL